MTGDRTIRRLLERPARSTASPGEEAADYSAYAHGRISRHIQFTLICRHADGSCQAFAYSFFSGASSDDVSLGFLLDFGGHRVKVAGRNLETLFSLICQHRVAEIRTMRRTEGFSAEPEVPVIERIEIQKG